MTNNPLHSYLSESLIRDQIQNDLVEAGLIRCQSVSWLSITRQITGFIWRVGVLTVTMPTITIKEHSQGVIHT